jgi:NAD(P)-dependent dehydrogenase (short-subunit alcohol dehydrogenase family)
MANELQGKVAIITGAASGIGRATAELFVAEGARVMLADIDGKRGRDLARELGSAAHFRRTDVASADDVEALVRAAVRRFGALDILFNNAGISGAQHPRFLDDDLSDFHRVIDVNLYSVLLGSRFAGRHMARHGGGVIINNASIAGVMPGQALVSYRASKAAVIHLSKCIAIDLAEYGIRVNCLAPGHIRTPLTAFTVPGMTEEQMVKIRDALAPVWDSNQPLKRHGRPQDVAQTVLFLSTDRSAQITGVVLPIDGGITAGDPVNHLRELFDARARALAPNQ